jgi:hypothetical protein
VFIFLVIPGEGDSHGRSSAAKAIEPIGVTFDPAQALVKVRSGNFYNAPAPA